MSREDDATSVLLVRVDKELNRVARLIDALVVAIGPKEIGSCADMTDDVERDAMREHVGVVGGNLFAMKAALRKALKRERERA
jgi:hypothetical protein